MTPSEYDAIDAVNWSTLKEMRRSPAHYLYALSHRRGDTPAMKLGRACHCAVLEPGVFAKRYAMWDRGIRRGKSWDAFQVDHGEKDILTEDEFGKCLEIQTAVRSHPTAADFLRRGDPEVVLQWSEPNTKLACKGRLDWDSNGTILDLKTCRDASPVGFGRVSYRMGYHSQLAYYSDGWSANHNGLVPRVVCIAVETEAPYVVTCFEVPLDLLDVGRKEYQELLNQVVTTKATNTEFGYVDGMAQLQLPAWAAGDDEDISALELTANQ